MPEVNMNDVNHIVCERFRIQGSLRATAADMRSFLLASHGRAKPSGDQARDHFIMYASNRATKIIRGAGSVGREAALRELRIRYGRDESAQQQLKLYLLLYIIDEARAVDAHHAAEWAEMRDWLASALVPIPS